jgi:hypothetical protein
VFEKVCILYEDDAAVPCYDYYFSHSNGPENRWPAIVIITDKQGHFEVRDVPVGKIHAWGERFNGKCFVSRLSGDAVVTEGGTSHLHLSEKKD